MSGLRRGLVGAVALLAAFALRAEVLVTQVFRPERPLRGNLDVEPCQPIDAAAWIWMPGSAQWGEAAMATDAWGRPWEEFPDFAFFRFRRDFDSDGSPLVFDVSADERFVLLLDGVEIARGPHRGFVGHWAYGSYRVTGLAPGSHRLEAVCGQLGAHAPIAQLSWRGGFVLRAEGAYDAALTTGRAAWRVAPLVLTRPTGRGTSRTFGGGSQFEVTGTALEREEPAADAWRSAAVVRGPIRRTGFGGRVRGWMLYPTQRADPLRLPKTPGRVVNASCDLTKPFVVPAHADLDLWWDLGDYYCGYPELRVSGGRGATVEWGWTESLRDAAGRKGDRGAWRGKEFSQALTDTFRGDGRADALFTTPWWRCGRWCRLRFRTGDAPLEVRGVRIVETRAPLAIDGAFACDDQELERIWRLCRRGMECCAHEMLVDCPYYEQQMYPGDTRIQCGVLAALTRDGRLPRFALSAFDWDRRPDGFLPMNAPSRGMQESSTYTVLWVCALRDMLYRARDTAWLKARLPGARQTLGAFAPYEDADGLLAGTPGWRFVDHTLMWGCPSAENLFYLEALRGMADLEECLGDARLAAIDREKAKRLAAAILKRYWNAGRGLFANDADQRGFSEHAQCLAVLSGAFDDGVTAAAFRGLVGDGDLVRCTSYFAHYMFKAYFARGRADLAFGRLDVWRRYLSLGAKTPFETDSPESRSDCHAWSATPIEVFASEVAGVKSVAPGFRRVRVAPQPGPLKRVFARVPHPDGAVEVDLAFDDAGRATGTVTLPEGLAGTFAWRGGERALAPGRNAIGR